MYNPVFSYTDKLVTNLIKIENLKTTLLTTDLSYNIKHKLNIKLKALDIFHLGHILGIDMNLKDAEKVSQGARSEGLKDPRNYMLSNFRNALEFNRSNIADTYSEFDFTILLHLNKLILTSWRESWEARFRNISDEIDIRHDNWIELKDNNVKGNEVENEILNLIEWYKNSAPTIPVLVRIGIILFRLIEIYPYVAGNYLTLIGLTDYLFLKNNLSSKSYFSVIRSFDLNNVTLKEAFKISLSNKNLVYWLEEFTQNIIKDLTEVREGISEYIVEDERSKKQPFLDLNKRQLKILRYLQSVPVIKREDYCHTMEVSTMTAFRDLNDLVKKKLLKVEGQGRGTKYRLASM